MASAHAVRRQLLDYRLVSLRPLKKPLLSSKNIADCWQFCCAYSELSAEGWGKVILLDKSPFNCFGNRGGVRVRNKKHHTSMLWRQ